MNAALKYGRVMRTARIPLRHGPSACHAYEVTVPKGAIVTIVDRLNHDVWQRVFYRHREGYLHRFYLDHVSLAGSSLCGRNADLIIVSTSRQQLEAYRAGRLVLISAITTGRPELRTPHLAGEILAKYSPFVMTSPWPPGTHFYFRDVLMQYAIKFSRPDYYLHHAPQRPYFGLGTNYLHLDPDGIWRTGSHGCVNMPLWSANRLYNLYGLGTPVAIIP